MNEEFSESEEPGTPEEAVAARNWLEAVRGPWVSYPADTLAAFIDQDIKGLVADSSLPEDALGIAWCWALAEHCVALRGEEDSGSVERVHDGIHEGQVRISMTFENRHEFIASVLDEAGIEPLFCTEDDGNNLDELTIMWELPTAEVDR